MTLELSRRQKAELSQLMQSLERDLKNNLSIIFIYLGDGGMPQCGCEGQSTTRWDLVLFNSVGSQESNTSHQVGQQVPIPTEPSCLA